MKNREKQLLVFFVVMGLVIFIYPDGAAAEVKKGFEIELYGGVLKTDMGQTIVVDSYRTIVTESEDGETFGIRLGYNFNQLLGLDWNLGYSTARYEASLFDSGVDPDNWISQDETTGLFITDLNLILHLHKGPIVPFLTAGGGIIGTVDQTPFAYNYGGGVKIFLTQKVAIRVDFRVYHGELKDELEEVDVGSGGTLVERPFSYKEDFDLQEISIGLTFLF
jgi:opacity protein-like surface antigen